MKKLNRYAAKLLFQFRMQINSDSGIRRLCEERIIVFQAKSPLNAINIAKKHGKNAEFSSIKSKNKILYFEFIGIRDMTNLDSFFCGEEEVWFTYFQKKLPMEKSSLLTRSEDSLLTELSSQSKGM